MIDDPDLVLMEFEPECTAQLLCIRARYDGFTPGKVYRVCGAWVTYEGASPMVIDDWNEYTAAGGFNGIFEAVY